MDYKTEAAVNLKQMRENLDKLEQLPEASPAGSPEDLDLILYGKGLSSQ